MTPAVGEAVAESLRPLRAFELRVSAVQQLTPHFRRITFTGPDLELFGSNAEGRTLDLRIKVMIPSPGHRLPELGHIRGSLQEDWYQNWRMLEESVRGVMRTYTVRSLRRGTPGSGSRAPVPAELDIDFVLHLDDGPGPAAEWAAKAQPGDAMTIIGPCARWGECSGIEFVPGFAQRVLLVGDETAVPAVAAILESLPAHVGGHAVLEVPDAADFQEISTNASVEVRWLARGIGAHGSALAAEVRSVVVPAACGRGGGS